MQLRHALFAGFILIASALPLCTQAATPVYRISSDCEIPSMPGKNATRADWDQYTQLVNEYNECMAEKAGKYGQKAKDALENVGEKVTGWADAASNWLKK